MAKRQSYVLPIDGRWTLEDLYSFPRAYEQVYFAIEAISPQQSFVDEDRLARAFQAFPWRGGYSAVSFYYQLKVATGRDRRPSIKSLQYSSPGWIELWLNLPQAVQIASVVTSIAGSIAACNKVYNQIHVDLQKRKLLRIDVEQKRIALTREEMGLVKEAAEQMADILNLGSPTAVDRRTEDPLISLKILLSVYRRARILAEYQNKGKVDFSRKGRKNLPLV